MTNQQNKCLYRESKQGKACMPNGGVNNIDKQDVGSTVTMINGDKYKCIECKFQRCL